MADYKRMVSYMYQYERGIKKKNVGYARVETRNGQSKLTLHLQLPGLSNSIFPTYLIQRNKEGIELIYLGDSSLTNQVMDSKLFTNEIKIMDAASDTSNIGGILIFLNDEVFYATEWDDKPVILEEVMAALKPKPKDIIEINEVIYSPEAMQASYNSDVDKQTREDSINEGLKHAQNEQKEPEVKVSEEVIVKPISQETKISEDIQEDSIDENVVAEDIIHESNPDENVVAEDKVDKDNVYNIESDKIVSNAEKQAPLEDYEVDIEHPLAKRIFDRYPRMYPFEDNEVIACVKLEPQDIGFLPMEAWVLSNNSFLLHGYYSYRHLVFAKIKDRYGCRYILGVPGIFHNRERFMARMFGFEQFKSVRKRELKPGEFGYWYITIAL